MNWLRNKMIGRYGTDQLGIFLLVISLLLALVGSFLIGWISIVLRVLGAILLIWTYFRMFSRKASNRRAENLVFLKFWNPIRNRFVQIKWRIKGRKTHKYYKCTKCKKKLRVPKGKGRINITCPQCGHKFIKNT